jgi:hypothetical protein
MTTLSSHPQSQLAAPMIGPVPHALAFAQSTLASNPPAESRDWSAPSADRPKLDWTLFEVIDAITEVAENDGEVLATLAHMLDSGRLKLSGSTKKQTTQAQIAW